MDTLLDVVCQNEHTHGVKNLPQFIDFITRLFEHIVQTKDYTVSNLLANYFKVMLPYMYESLNDEKIKPKILNKKVAQAQTVLLQQINTLLGVYKEYLTQAIKE